MKHSIIHRKLNRTSSHRKALLMNLSNALLKHEQIVTTLTKAKELRPFVEKIITLGKKNKESSRSSAFSSLRDKAALVKVFNDLSERYRKRNGGYCRIVKAGYRTGDNAPMAYIQLLDQETAKKASK